MQISHQQAQLNTVMHLIGEYGLYKGEDKIRNFTELGDAPLSTIAFHNQFLHQVRDSFIIGAFYPALTGASALGERILNHLLLKLRSYFKETPQYKKVSKKDQFDDWNVAIRCLEAWQVLLPDVVSNYELLNKVRNRKAIHFNPETDSNAREYALEAIGLLSQIIRRQFGASGDQPWFIPNIPGASFIRKEAEALPFVKEVYLPKCQLVGPYHKLELIPDSGHYKSLLRDDHEYENREITDEEFAELLRG